MTKVLLLLFIVVVSVANVYAQDSKKNYFGDMNNSIILKSPRAQVIREIEKYLTTQKKVRISDITVEVSDREHTKGWHNINFTLTPTQKKYNFDCFPLPKYGEEGEDEDWVKVSLDTTNFMVQKHCGIDLSDFEKDGYTYTKVRLFFDVLTESIETHSTQSKKVRCFFTDLTADLKAHLASKFKTK